MVGDRFGVRQRIRDANRYSPDIGKQAMAWRPRLYSDANCIGLNPTMKMPGDIEIDQNGQSWECK